MKNAPSDAPLTMSDPAVYRIIVQGMLDPSWSGRLGNMTASEKRSDDSDVRTILVGRLADQAALSSVINTLYELHLPIVSADCLEIG